MQTAIERYQAELHQKNEEMRQANAQLEQLQVLYMTNNYYDSVLIVN